MSSEDEYDEIQSPPLSLHVDDLQSPSSSSEPASRDVVDIEYPDNQPQQLRDQVERLACHLNIVVDDLGSLLTQLRTLFSSSQLPLTDRAQNARYTQTRITGRGGMPGIDMSTQTTTTQRTDFGRQTGTKYHNKPPQTRLLSQESQTETDQISRREADTQTWAGDNISPTAVKKGRSHVEPQQEEMNVDKGSRESPAGEVEFEYADLGAEKEEGGGSVNSEDVAENADQAPTEAVELTENQERARERRIQQLTSELRNARQERNDLKFMLDQLEGQLGPARLLRRTDIDP